jgi:REP element-mobilizing transposase RayT
MPRKPREDYAGAWQHVMHRGARRAPIFRDDSHCQLFLDTLSTMVDRFELEVHAYSLMPNHYHLLTRSVHGNLSDGMRYLNATYTQRLNAIHRWDGPIFRGRFRSQAVRDETNLPYVLAYIHLNPLRANLVTRLDQKSWTSHRQYLCKDRREEWLTTRFFLELLGGKRKMHEYVLGLHRGSIDWPEELTLRTGWFTSQGEEASRNLRTAVSCQFVDQRFVLRRVCEITGATRGELRRTVMGPRANPPRRFAVWALAKQTLLTHAEIGKLLDMSTTQVANVLRVARRDVSTLPEEWIVGWRGEFDK